MAELVTNNVDELADFWAKEVYPFVKPVVEADRRERPSPVGSGILVSCYGKQFLLTAHHVIPPSSNAEGALYTFVPEQVELGGMKFYLPDPFDLSVIEIPQPTGRGLRLPQHLARDVREGELCLLLHLGSALGNQGGMGFRLSMAELWRVLAQLPFHRFPLRRQSRRRARPR